LRLVSASRTAPARHELLRAGTGGQVVEAQKPKLLDQVRDAIRTRHYSYRTEEAYVGWIKRFIFFHHKRHPAEMGPAEITQFLTSLAVDRHVSASTQNQALAALLFLYRDVLGCDPGWLDDIVRAKRPQRLPVVLTHQEVAALLATLKYLSRYTHRVAIANHRLLAVANGVVRFEYHDYADPDVRKELPLPATEFLRRFLLHVVPKGLMRIRHYGITANRRRQDKLARCRELLGTTPAPPPATPLPAGADTAAATPEDTTPRCPQCGASLRIVEILPPQPHDTS
jgi:hypothetical protein